ncbi:immunoglobulin domain-containing protein [Pelagicoccus mobilis]|uniref:Immunoglobulin domain-containing protein n=1 Tax=Pelagicoccus mobilis TaxID=415221 RepID=A0A934S0X0_9BACT|nr:immunoglobulin domain-containing protein [Pelagicoccus mobilis]MBK1877419.1 immunoglobulin domain-containing protein [Pelagicoccus mobilis]
MEKRQSKRNAYFSSTKFTSPISSLRTFLALLVLIVTFAFSGGNLQADPVVVPILNPSFEEPVVTLEDSYWFSGAQDWTVLGGLGTVLARDGLDVPNTATEGIQIAYGNSAEHRLIQEVGTMDANTTYTFSIDVTPIGADLSSTFLSVFIEDSQTWTPSPAQSHFRPSWDTDREDFALTHLEWTTVTLSFNSENFESINGNTIRVQMFGTNIAYDNARLTKEVNPTLFITAQPVSQIAEPGDSVTLSVEANSTAGDVSYQWQKWGTDIEGATGMSLVVDPVTGFDAGEYSVVVTNDNGSLTSSTVTVTVADIIPVLNPSFEEPALSSPDNMWANNLQGWTDINGGENVGGGTTIARPGISGAEYASDGTQIAFVASEHMFVQNLGILEPHSLYTIMVDIAPHNDPATTRSEIFVEAPVDFTQPVQIAHRPDWDTERRDFILEPGKWTTVTGYIHTDSWDGSVQEWGTEGDISGKEVRLRFAGEFLSYDNVRIFRTYMPSITTQPTDLAVTEGEAAVLSVAADALPVPFYQWKKNGEDILGANGPSLNIPSSAFDDAASYTVVVANNVGSVESAPATLAVNPASAAPEIALQPASQAAGIGGSATFRVVATGIPAPTYQWKRGTLDIEGATSSELTIQTVEGFHTGDYSVVVTNSEGSVTSNAAMLYVGEQIILQNPSFESPDTDGWHPTVNDWDVARNIGTTYVNEAWAQYPAPDGDQVAWGGTNTDIILTQTVGTVEANTVYTVSVDIFALGELADTSASVIFEENDNFSVRMADISFDPSGDPAREDFTLKAGYWNTITASFDSQFFDGTDDETDVIDQNMWIHLRGDGIAFDNVRLVKTSAPAITTQPMATEVIEGSQAVLSVVATGAPAPTYQWKKGADDIDGATSSSLTIDTVAIDDAGDYSVVITNFLGSVTSDAAALTVTPLEAPAITEQPMDLTVVAPAAASFSVVATGVPAPSYQWQKGGIDIEGANNATLTINPTDSVNAGEYSVVVTNSQGSVSSNVATLTVNLEPDSAPVVTTHPLSQTVTAPASVTFSVESTGFPVPTYQWKKDGVDIPGANSVTYTIDPTSVEDAGDYSVTLTNSEGSDTSNAATLAVNPPLVAPEITLNPQSQTVPATSTVVFTSAASGNPEPTYQWQKNGVNIDGETGSSLTIDAVDVSNAGDFSVIATNSEGEATSAVATLTVTQPTAFDSWAISYGLSGADLDMMADPDNDGDNNLFEYATGGHPAGGADPIASRPSVKLVKVNGVEELQYSYPQRLNAPELSYQVETANSLDDSWSETGYEAMTPNTAINDDFELVTVRVLVGTDPGFVRLVINYTAL